MNINLGLPVVAMGWGQW